MWRAAILCSGVYACGDSEVTNTSPDPGLDAAENSDDDVTPTCVALTEGSWSASGTCFMMDMSATLTLTGDACTFDLTDWNMGMSVPDGGTVAGEDVSFTGTDWDDCAG